MWQRVAIIGASGAGKSSLARRLGPILGIEPTHLDAHYWQPGWVASDPADWAERVAAMAAGRRWILDGNYGRTMPIRLAAADTIVFLDIPRWRCIGRVIRRSLRGQLGGETRPDLAPGCQERIGASYPSFLAWIWRYRRRSRPRVLALLAEAGPEQRVFHLRDQAGIEAMLDQAMADRTARQQPAMERSPDEHR